MKPPKTDYFSQFNKTAAIDGNVIKNKSKDVAVCYKLSLPEIFTMGEPEFDAIHTDFLKMCMMLPDGTIIHKKDIYKKNRYDSENLLQETYLQQSTHEHFKGRIFMQHSCILSFILPDISSLRRPYDKLSILSKKTTIAAIEEIESFITSVEQGISVLNTSTLMQAEPMSEEEIYDVIFDEYSLFKNEIGDYISNKDEFKIGDNHVKIMALRDDGQQKDGTLQNCVLDKKRSTDQTQFFRSYSYPISLELDCDHVYNQFIFIEDQNKVKSQLELNSKRLGSSSLLNRKNRILAEKNNQFLDSVEKDNVKIVRVHTNIVFWAESREELKILSNKITGLYSQMEIIPYNCNFFDRDYIYLANHLGNAALLPLEETFLSYLDLALCYLSTETNYRSEKSGILMNDRINNLPLYVDVFHQPYEEKKIINRNYIIIAPSGGGKSFLSKSKLRQNIENPNNRTVVLNIGGDDKLCRMYKDDSLYFFYKEGQPLNLNPFYAFDNKISKGKLEFITEFIGLLWKTGEELTNDESSSLDKILLQFYGIKRSGKNDENDNDFEVFYDITNKDNNSIKKFYNYIKDNSEEIKKLTFGLFSIDSLVLNLEKYAEGVYSNLFVDGEPQKFENKKFIEFELDNIKDHKLLFPIFGMVISDLIFTTMWKNDGTEKDFFVDEAWKVLEKKGMASLLKYLYKTVRKFDGACGIAVQQITDMAQLGDDERAILGNTAIKYILDHRNALADVPILKEKLSMRNADISMLLSIQNNTKPTSVNPLAYTEMLLMRGSYDSKIMRLEVSKPCLAVYESDKNKLRTFDRLYEHNRKNMIRTIEDYIEVEINKTKQLTDFII